MAETIKIVFFSDSHLGFDYPLRGGSARRRRGEDFFRNHESVLKYAKEIEADLVLHGGDFFYRTKIPQMIIAKAYDSLIHFAENYIPIVIVPGNHESSRLPDSLLTSHPMINIFDGIQTFHFELKGIKINVSGFPYHRDNLRDKFPEISGRLISNRKEADMNLLLLHHAIEGVTCGPGNYTFRQGTDVIQMKDIPAGFDAVLSGHIHRKQILWKSFGNKHIPVIYPGSIERTSFAEKEETKGFYLMEWQLGPTKLKSLKFLRLPARPMVDYIIPEEMKSLQLLQSNFIKFIARIHPDSIIRIKVKNKSVIKALNTNFLKDTVPVSMNIEFSGLGRGSRKKEQE